MTNVSAAHGGEFSCSFPPVPPPPSSSAIAAPASRTLAEKVAIIKKELDLPHDATVASAVAEANTMLGISTKGSMRAQVDAILAELEPQTNEAEDKPVTAPVSAELCAEPRPHAKHSVEWSIDTELASVREEETTHNENHHASRPSLTTSRSPAKVVKQIKLRRMDSFKRKENRYRLQLMKEVTKRLKLGLKLSRVARCQLIEHYTPEPILINITKLEEVIQFARKLEQRIGELPETVIAQKRLKEARKAKSDLGNLEARLKDVHGLLAQKEEPTDEDCELLQKLIRLAEQQGWDVQQERQTLEALIMRRKACLERKLASLAQKGQGRQASVPELQQAIRDAKMVRSASNALAPQGLQAH